MIVLTLPYPISVNAMYRNRLKGRAKSERYRTWLNAVGWEIKAQRQQPIKGSYTLRITLYEADNRRRDPGNMEKCISDALVEAGLIEDDSLCVSMEIARCKTAGKARCGVVVFPSNGIPVEEGLSNVA